MTLRRRMQAWLMGAVLALSTPIGGVPASVLLGGALVIGVAGEAWARSAPRSSGGYSRPSSRTPSFAPQPSAPRTPSTSGGYSLPSSNAPTFRAPAMPSQSAGDRALSRERSAQGLQDQRDQQQRAQQQQQQALEAARRQQQQPTAPASSQSWSRDTRRQPPPLPRNDFYAQRGWSAPPYAAAAPRSFGVWDGLFLWFMLDNLTKPGYTDFFRNQRNDPGVQQWRAQADAMARDNADLRRKLADLDANPGSGEGSSGWVEVPPDIPAGIAQAKVSQARTPGLADEQDGGGMGSFLVIVLVLAAGAAIAFLVIRRRARARAANTGGASQPMTALQSAAAMVANVVAPKAYLPAHFRVGMVLNTDLSPFILAAGATKVVPPEASGSGTMTVAALGRIGEGASALVRLHLADRRSLFQLHLDSAGTPDECRFFSLFDEVAPADAAEWGVWLDPASGMIGWPEFQTQDGRVYARVWSPGDARVAPLQAVEDITTAEGTEQVRMQMMLYAAPTGLAAPAPSTEFILVSAVERAGQAWVELRAGIDINPAALELT